MIGDVALIAFILFQILVCIKLHEILTSLQYAIRHQNFVSGLSCTRWTYWNELIFADEFLYSLEGVHLYLSSLLESLVCSLSLQRPKTKCVGIFAGWRAFSGKEGELFWEMTVLQFLKTQNSKSFWLLWIEPERFFRPFAPFENQVLVLCWHSSLSNIIDINTSRICDFIIKPKSYYFFPIPCLIIRHGNRDLSSYGSSGWKEGNCEVLKLTLKKF